MPRIFPVLMFAVVLITACEQPPQPIEIIELDSGAVSGQRTEDGTVLAVKGIPYAAPPVGDLRWQPPKSVDRWTGVMPCTAFAASAMQPVPEPFMMYTSEYLIPKEPISEDCLYLNVWTAAKTKDDQLPVLIWIHGGGYVTGGSACPIYDGEDLAKKGIIVVTINYRVGLMGFFAHPELTAESTVSASGNYGFLDQLAALKWVKRNIAAFGGDPDQVTIAGQSAGSGSVQCLVASPLATGLFHRAIGESGAATMRPMSSREQAEQLGAEAFAQAGISDLAAARSLPADTLMARLGNNYSPIEDGYFLPKPVRELLTEGDYNDVPTLLGWNQDEGFMPRPPLGAADFQKSLVEQFGPEAAERLLRYYPATNDEVALESQWHLSTHRMFALPVLQWAEIQSESGEQSVFLYHFDHTPPGSAEFTRFKAHHTAEVPYALHTLKNLGRPWEPVDDKLESLMSDYWVNFVKNGNPNSDDLPVWVEFEPGDPLVMQFSTVGQEILTGMTPVPELSAINALRSAQ